MKTQGFEARFSQNLAPVSREKPESPYLAYISHLFSKSYIVIILRFSALAALTAGAVAAAKDTAEKGVKDTYQGLKTLIKRKFANDALAQAMVEAKPEDIKKAEGLLST